MPGAHSNLIFTCQIWTIFYFTESEAISQNTCFRERLPDLSGIGQFHRTFQSGNRFVLLMEKLMKTSSPKKELAVSPHIRPSSAESLFFSLTGRQRKIILLLRKENAFYHPIICEYKLLPEWKHEKLINNYLSKEEEARVKPWKILLPSKISSCILLCIKYIWFCLGFSSSKKKKKLVKTFDLTL